MLTVPLPSVCVCVWGGGGGRFFPSEEGFDHLTPAVWEVHAAVCLLLFGFWQVAGSSSANSYGLP